MPKSLLIVNPTAGRGKALKLLPQVEDALRKEGIEFDVSLTERKGHAVLLAREAAQKKAYSKIAALGGDGTLGEVSHGVLLSGQRGQKVSFLPGGTGNDFVGGSGFYDQAFPDAISALVKGKDRYVDAILVEDARGEVRYGLNSVGFGYDAYVVKRTQELGAKKLGQLGYMYEALRGLFTFRPVQGMITKDGLKRHEEGLWLLALTNSERFGGGMRVGPNALVDDGFLECSMLQGVPKLNLVRLLLLVREGKHLGEKGVHQKHVKSITVDFPEDTPAHIDGDFLKLSYPVSVKILPGALRLQVSCKHAAEEQAGSA